MAIAHRAGNATVSATNSGTAVSHTLPAGIQVNDLILLFLAWNNGGTGVTCTTPTGYTLLDTIDSSTNSTRVYYKVAVSGDTSSPAVTATLSAGKAWEALCEVYSGIDTATPVNAHSLTASGTASTGHACPTVTVTVANCWLTQSITARSASTNFNTPAGLTLRVTAAPGAYASPVLGNIADSGAVVSTGSQGGAAWVSTNSTSESLTAVMATIAIQPLNPNGTVTAPAATSTSAAVQPVVTGDGVLTGGGAATSISAAVAPAVTGGAVVTATVATATSQAAAPVVTGQSNATVSAVAATATADAAPPTVVGLAAKYLFSPPQWRNVQMLGRSLRYSVMTSTVVYRQGGVWHNVQTAGIDAPVVNDVDVDATTGLRLFFSTPTPVPLSLVPEVSSALTPADPSWTPGTLTLA